MLINNQNITVRSISAEDAESYLQFAKAIIKEERYSVTHINEFHVTVADEQEWINRILNNPNNLFLIAIADDRIIASVSIMQKEQLKQRHLAELTINVLEAYRNQGIGTLLMREALLTVSNNDEIDQIILEVFKSNERAVHLYQAFGFHIIADLPAYVLQPNGDVEDVLVMQKPLH